MKPVSKQKKASVKFIDRLKLTKEDKDLPRLFDMIALVSIAGAAVLLGGGYVLDLLGSRSMFTVLLFCLVSSGLAYGTGRFMKDHPEFQVKYFKHWFAATVVISVLLILSLGMFW